MKELCSFCGNPSERYETIIDSPVGINFPFKVFICDRCRLRMYAKILGKPRLVSPVVIKNDIEKDTW